MTDHRSIEGNSTTSAAPVRKPKRHALLALALAGLALAQPLRAQQAADELSEIEALLASGNWQLWLVTPFRPGVLAQCQGLLQHPLFEGLEKGLKPPQSVRLNQTYRLEQALVIHGRSQEFVQEATQPVPGKKALAYQAGVVPGHGTCFVLASEGKPRFSGGAILAGGVHNLPFPSLLLDPFSTSARPEFKLVPRYVQPARSPK